MTATPAASPSRQARALTGLWSTLADRRIYYARRVASAPFRYQSPEEDSAPWLGFPFRDGDIVISTRSKTGTT